MHWKPALIEAFAVLWHKVMGSSLVLSAMGAFIMIVASGCSDPSGPRFTDPPPTRFRNDGGYFLVTASAQVIAEVCGNPAARFCTVGQTIYAPNPCIWSDGYAKGICHEAGHAQGWPADHSR